MKNCRDNGRLLGKEKEDLDQDIFKMLFTFFACRFLEVTWDEYEDPVSGENRTGYFPTELRRTPLYISIYVTWMYLVFMYIVPFTTLAG